MAGQAAFKSTTRPEPISMTHFDLPGPGEYTNEAMQNALGYKLNQRKNSNSKQQFGVM
jgi:hypothetical protein